MNEKNYTITLSRLEVCDILLACSHVKWDAIEEMEKDPDCPEYRRTVVLPGTVKKWGNLHDKIERQLNGNDANAIFCELKARYDSGDITKEELQSEMARRVGFLF